MVIIIPYKNNYKIKIKKIDNKNISYPIKET